MLTQATSRLSAASWRLSSRRSALQQGRPICFTASAKPRLRTAVKSGVHARLLELREDMWEDEVYTGNLPSLVLFYTADGNPRGAFLMKIREGLNGWAEEQSYNAAWELRENEARFMRHVRLNMSCMEEEWYGAMHVKYDIGPWEPSFLLFKEGRPVENSCRAVSWFFDEEASFAERMQAYLIEQGVIDPNADTTVIGDTIKDVELVNDHLLRALCKDSEGNWQESILDLDWFLTNNDGKVEVVRGLGRPGYGDYSESCKDIGYYDGVLFGKAKAAAGEHSYTWVNFAIDLTKWVENTDGQLKLKQRMY